MRSLRAQIIKRDETVINTSKETSSRAKSKSTKLLERSGYIADFGSGLYGLTNLGQETRQRVEDVIRQEHVDDGCVEVCIPSLQYSEDWEKSGRWGKFEGEMFTFKNRDASDMCLAPTHEEGIVRMFRDSVRSYNQLPMTVFQIKEKHRDDKARQGLLRAKEFVMKDAYSLHSSEESMFSRYEQMKELYSRIFEKLGLEIAEVEANVGVMGGSESMEFVAPSKNGDDNLLYCSNCRFGVTDEHEGYDDFIEGDNCPECSDTVQYSDGVEVGHIFALGTRYSSNMNFTFDTSEGNEEYVYMASYGIGVTRVMQTLIEQNGSADSCNWMINQGYTCSPFDVCIIRANDIEDYTVNTVRNQISNIGLRCLEYTNNRGIGEQFSESDLIGIPMKIILGNHWKSSEEVEIELWNDSRIYTEIELVEDSIRSIYSS